MRVFETEPCCYPKHLNQIFLQLDSSKQQPHTILFRSAGDWTLAQLLGWLKTLVPGGKMTLFLPEVETSTVNTLLSLLEQSITLVGRMPCHAIETVNLIVNSTGCNDNLLASMRAKFPNRFNVASTPMNDYTAILIEGESTEKSEGYRYFAIVGGFSQHIDRIPHILSLTNDTGIYDAISHVANYQIIQHPICQKK